MTKEILNALIEEMGGMSLLESLREYLRIFEEDTRAELSLGEMGSVALYLSVVQNHYDICCALLQSNLDLEEYMFADVDRLPDLKKWIPQFWRKNTYFFHWIVTVLQTPSPIAT